MDEIKRINELFRKGRINEKEYEELYNKYKPADNSIISVDSVGKTVDKIINILSSMSIEELLDVYDQAETETEKNIIKQLIIAEIEDRIN